MKKAKRILMSEWPIVLVLTLLVTGAYLLSWGPFMALESKAYDMRAKMVKAEPDAPITIITIDESSIEGLGRWPWPRDIMAEAIAILGEMGASVIGIDVFFS